MFTVPETIGGMMKSKNPSGLSGVVIVTGAAGEIGRAACRLIADSGAKVLAVDANSSVLTTARQINERGGSAMSAIADVTDPEQVDSFTRQAMEFGRLTGFVNNAGTEGEVAPIGKMSVTSFDSVMAVNTRGVFLGLSAVLPLLPPGGAIVNTASTAGLRGSAGMAAYVASKHAVIGMTKVAALEAASRGIRVNAVCPSAVESRMMVSLDRQRAAVGLVDLANERLGRRATADDVALAIRFLLSSESAFVSGSMLPVDGTRTAG